MSILRLKACTRLLLNKIQKNNSFLWFYILLPLRWYILYYGYNIRHAHANDSSEDTLKVYSNLKTEAHIKLDLQIKAIAVFVLCASALAHCEKGTGNTIAIMDRLKHEWFLHLVIYPEDFSKLWNLITTSKLKTEAKAPWARAHPEHRV